MQLTKSMPRLFVPLAAVALLLSACGDKKSSDLAADVASTDTMRIATTGDSAPSVQVIPPAPTPAPTAEEPLVSGREPAPRPKPRPAAVRAPSRPARTPAPAGPRVVTGTVASGTSIGVTSGAKVCSNTLAVGDRITATTNSAIDASNGVTIPAGARVGLVVTESKTSSGQGSSSSLMFDVRSLTYGGDSYDVTGTVSTDAVVQERKGGDGKKVAIGAAAGAVIGNIIGGGSRAQRTVVGAAAGGLAGAAAAAATGDRLACLPEGSPLTVRLGSALTVKN